MYLPLPTHSNSYYTLVGSKRSEQLVRPFLKHCFNVVSAYDTSGNKYLYCGFRYADIYFHLRIQVHFNPLNVS